MKNTKLAAWVILGSYIIVRLLGDSYWRLVSPYFAYGFEVVFVGACYLFYRSQIQIGKIQNIHPVVDIFIPLGGGYLVYKLAGFAGIGIPFDLSGGETIFLLLILAPFLEEAIFRMALWEPLKALVKSPAVLLCSSALLFSAGHFVALWSVPEPYRVFVLYQSLYVILLGLGCGWRRYKTNSVLNAIGVHISFNLGFFLASF